MFCTLLLGCFGNHASHPGFQLKSVMLPGDGWFKSTWISAVPGQLGFRVRDRDRRVEDSGSSVAFSFGEDNQFTELGSMPKLPYVYPKLLLEGGQVLLSSGERGKENLSIISFPEGVELACTLPQPASIPGLPKGRPEVGYWPEFGLAQFFRQYDFHTIHVWAGSEDFSLTDETHEELAFGWGFIGGELIPAVILQDASVELFNPATFKFEPSPEMDWLAAFAKKIIPTKGIQYRFAFSENVAAMNLMKTVMCINADGQTHHIPLVDYFERDYLGKWRPGAWQSPIGIMPDDALAYKEEARSADTRNVGRMGHPKPLDNSRIAIFDRVYQRLIVVGPELEDGSSAK